MQEEMAKDGNGVCAECFSLKPTCVSLNLGVFVCQKCAKFHKKLEVDRNNVVDIKSHRFTAEQLDHIKHRGNVYVNENFEKYLPIYYHRPDADDPPVIREQFIKAKYSREEFKDASNQSAYNNGLKTGNLFKKGKDNEKFLLRKFVLREPEGTLEYFIKFADKNPKDSIIVRNIVNVFMVPDKVGNMNGMQITHEKDGVRRNLFLYGENGKVTIDWYHALRASMVRHKYKSFPDEQMKRYLNSKIIREGWMSKTGPKRQEKFRKRWFSLVGTMVWYYTAPLDAHPLGYIPLGSRTFGFGVMKGLPTGINIDGYGLTIHTPERIYALNCASLESRDKWIKAITKVLDDCTNVWSQPAVGKLGYEKKEVSESFEDISEPLQQPSAFANLSKKYREASEASDAYSSSVPSGTTVRKPLFEKKPNNGGGGNKYVKKPASLKRHSTTKKVQDDMADSVSELTVVGRDEVGTDEGQKNSAANGESSRGKAYSHASKMYSDDSDDDDDHWNPDEHSLSSSYDSEDSQDYVACSIKPAEMSSNNDFDLLKEIDSASKTSKVPKKPPRSHMKQNSNQSDSDSIDLDPSSSKARNRYPDPTQSSSTYEDTGSGSTSLGEASPLKTAENANNTSSSSKHESEDKKPNPNSDEVYVEIEEENPYSFADGEGSRPPKEDQKKDSEDHSSWRKNTFCNSIRRVQGTERFSLRKAESSPKRKPSQRLSTSSLSSDAKENKPRPVDVILTNHTEKAIWFMAFQSELDCENMDSYVTPWIGAQIAEAPASVGPIRIPNTFEIAVIDTAPGGFGIQRTTGPFYAEPGDVWEVELPSDDKSSPEVFYHQGMETDDGSVAVYANVDNAKKFEIAVYKNGRKLFSRKGVKAGENVNLQVKQSLYLMAVDEDAYFELEGQDLRASEIIETANCLDINYRQPKMKIITKKRGESIIFTKL